MSFAVPTIDITPYVQGGSADEKAAVARAVDEACRTVGFMQVTGHGIPDEVIEGLKGAMDAFFLQELDAKKAYQTPPGINRGYAPPKSESLSLSLGVESASKMNDFFEAFNIGLTRDHFPGHDVAEVEFQDNVWPDVDGFETDVTTYFDEARRVARTLAGIFPDALGLPSDYFDAGLVTDTGTMRMNNYALAPGQLIELDGDLRGMGEHTDFGVVTVLWADQVKGLQVLGSDGGWYDASPADGALLVNLGDVMGRWTNDQWMSTLHRVKPPIVDGQIERRRSAAYFFSAAPETVIAPIPEILAEGEHPLYDPITVTEHTQAKLAGSRGGKRNDTVPGDAARVLSSHY
ncbi:isopenicillin N synthase family oxygenase [Herbiconiux moechotypicola]|uniref:2-oxoglutarate and iron-dependent oxygenase domain-containing protein n=1 Tax=Herbiconiux moechotypicola TaxID=637393 RepID=A0ABN3DDG0_9MICO|nr:2-oxoglutarate and iron-dependent oxygenase domain-containing protein [Herbiconiux moechotypicola]MCS5729182.1 isopenicillin N synthase family oxygenase [Herbiconiux moechotypicola]